MTCITCGTELEDAATTCAACGEPVVVSDHEAVTDAESSSHSGTGVGATAGTARIDAGGHAGPAVGDGTNGTPRYEASGSGAGAYEASGSGAGAYEASDPGPGAYEASGSGPGGYQTPGSGVGAYGTPGAYGYPGPGGGGPTNPWDQPVAPHPSGLPSDVRGWAIAAHLGGLLAAMMTAATLGFFGPLLVWLVKREDHPFIDHHAKEALNFQLTVLVALLSTAVLAIPAVIFGVVTLGLGFIALAGLILLAIFGWVALPIVGAVRAANGEGYRYPVTIRFIR